MTVTPSINPDLPWFEQIGGAEPDVLRSLLKTFVEALMSAEADAICGAPYGVRSEDLVNSRNGYRSRDWDTRTGSMELAIPKLRSGSYFPDWLLERRRRAERALTTVVATCYLLGVRRCAFTRRSATSPSPISPLTCWPNWHDRSLIRLVTSVVAARGSRPVLSADGG